MGRTEQKYTWKDHLFNISLVLFFILPQNGLLYFFVPVAMIMVTDWKKPQGTNLKYLIWLLLGSLFITFWLNIMSSWVSSKNILKLIELTMLLFCFGRLRSFVIIKEYLVFLVIYLIAFQFAYQLDVPLLGQVMQQIYPLDVEELEKYAFRQDMGFSDIGGYSTRLGGIYYNSNNCASFLEMLFLLVVNERKQLKKGLFLLLVALLLVGIISTGSRTSMLVLAIFMLFMFFSVEKSEKWMTLIFIFASFAYYLSVGSTMRIFAVREGMDDSFLTKLGILGDYITSMVSSLRLLFGCLSGNYLVVALGKPYPGTDFDIGDITVTYGFIFDFVLLIFLFHLFKNLGQYRVFMVVLIWCFSNTIFMSYRASALFILIASMYYSRNLLCQRNSQ